MQPTRKIILLAGVAAFVGACNPHKQEAAPIIEFTKLPPAGEGSPDRLEIIEGRVRSARRDQRIVLYAKAGVWWVQPVSGKPFTSIGSDFRFRNLTHPGSSYAALLVNPGFSPPLTAKVLPSKDSNVAATTVADGVVVSRPTISLRFSGYEWEVRQTPINSGGTPNLYDPANARVDASGFLHLRIEKQGDLWTSAEVKFPQSLGYGTYRFTVRDISHFEPAEVLNISIWDNSAPPREVDVEISRWGEVDNKNMQYVIQPYYVPENSVRFMAPAGQLTHSIRWQPDQVSFDTTRGNGSDGKGSLVSSHVFTSGIPSPGNDTIYMNFYVFASRKNPLKDGAEVVIEKFEYLP